MRWSIIQFALQQVFLFTGKSGCKKNLLLILFLCVIFSIAWSIDEFYCFVFTLLSNERNNNVIFCNVYSYHSLTLADFYWSLFFDFCRVYLVLGSKPIKSLCSHPLKGTRHPKGNYCSRRKNEARSRDHSLTGILELKTTVMSSVT